MNYIAHALPFLDRPYFVAGTSVPDWLSVIDRKMRVRSRTAQTLVKDEDPRVADVAQGIIRHHDDDRWFHQTRAFAELTLQLTAAVRQVLPQDDGFRPSFLGHILVEILLDAALIVGSPDRLAAYYEALRSIDPQLVGRVVNQLATRPSDLWPVFIPRFCAEPFLYDYLEDAKLLSRLNRVMRRIQLPMLPDEFLTILPSARHAVGCRCQELLAAPRPAEGRKPEARVPPTDH
jgi:hypothetical protein